jgi:ADP-heptose:LPS heptosyltransferase
MTGKKILLIQTSFIGDIILLSSAIENVYRHLEPEGIDILINQNSESLYRHHPLLRNILSWDKKQHKYKNLIRLIRQVRNEKYDVVLNFHRYFSTGLLTASSKATLKAGFSDNPLAFTYDKKVPFTFHDNLHEVDRNHLLLKMALPDLQSAVMSRRPVLYPSTGDRARVSIYQRNDYLCICPSSVWFTKQLPRDRWVNLIHMLDFKGSIYLLGAPDDYRLCEDIKLNFDDKVINLAGELTLLQSASLMQKAVINYVNDSAPLHLASAMNAPVCAFFCSTVTDFGFYPLSDFSEVLQTEGNLYCRPCGKHGYACCPERHFRCAYEISLVKAVQVFHEAQHYHNKQPD